MPKTAAWGKTIDARELTVNAGNRPLASPRRWEIHTKAGNGIIGSVFWISWRREYAFVSLSLNTVLGSKQLLDIGRFCQNQTTAMLAEKRKAAG